MNLRRYGPAWNGSQCGFRVLLPSGVNRILSLQWSPIHIQLLLTFTANCWLWKALKSSFDSNASGYSDKRAVFTSQGFYPCANRRNSRPSGLYIRVPGWLCLQHKRKLWPLVKVIAPGTYGKRGKRVRVVWQNREKVENKKEPYWNEPRWHEQENATIIFYWPKDLQGI